VRRARAALESERPRSRTPNVVTPRARELGQPVALESVEGGCGDEHVVRPDRLREDEAGSEGFQCGPGRSVEELCGAGRVEEESGACGDDAGLVDGGSAEHYRGEA